MKTLLRAGYNAVLLFYAALLFHTVFIARDDKRSINLIPFDMIAAEGLSLNVWGNIVMFIPLGVYVANYLKKLKKRHFWYASLIVMLTSIVIECVQFIAKRGATDIDDVLLNTFGGLLGMMLFAGCKYMFPQRLQQVLSIISLAVGVPVMLLVVLLIVIN